LSDVYFYATCLVDLFYPEAGLAGIELLRAAGLRVIFPRGQTCCGQPAFNCGYWEQARAVARAQLALFPRDLPVVLPSGSCCGMIRTRYPELFRGQPEEAAARALAGRVFELTQFLVDQTGLKLEDLGPPVKVTLHASCHAMRDQGVLASRGSCCASCATWTWWSRTGPWNAADSGACSRCATRSCPRPWPPTRWPTCAPPAPNGYCPRMGAASCTWAAPWNARGRDR